MSLLFNEDQKSIGHPVILQAIVSKQFLQKVLRPVPRESLYPYAAQSTFNWHI